MPSHARTIRLVAALAALAALTACGDTDDPAAGSAAVDVTASDSGCEVSDTKLSAGPVTFAVTNEGSQITEVYVYGEDGNQYTEVVSEVENIGPGTSRDMAVDLAGGNYEIACKPGQAGDGIRTPITVQGPSGLVTEPGFPRSLGKPVVPP